jgi:hypothetical protein
MKKANIQNGVYSNIDDDLNEILREQRQKVLNAASFGVIREKIKPISS